MTQKKIENKKRQVSIGLYPEFVELMDIERGYLSRSDFVGSLLYNYFVGEMPPENRFLLD